MPFGAHPLMLRYIRSHFGNSEMASNYRAIYSNGRGAATASRGRAHGRPTIPGARDGQDVDYSK